MSRVAYYASRGVQFARNGRGDVEVYGPDDPALMAELRADVTKRVALVHPLPRAGEYGACECCWDPLPNYRAGCCVLCELATQRRAA